MAVPEKTTGHLVTLPEIERLHDPGWMQFDDPPPGCFNSRMCTVLGLRPDDATLYHEAGHILVAAREGCQIDGIEFFNPSTGYGAMSHYRWMTANRELIGQQLARKVRVSVAGLHAQAILAPGSLSKQVRLAMRESMFYGREHSWWGKLNTAEIADFGLARDDIKFVHDWMKARRHARPGRFAYLRRREREVRKFLSTPLSQRRAKAIVDAMNTWFQSDGPQRRGRPGPMGGYTYCSSGPIIEALRSG